MDYDGRIILAAHRGDKARCPENTMAAFRAAIELGADMIETDVRMTRDGELVLIHDANTLRTTGYDGIISEMTLGEVRALDAGSLFSDKFAGERIPTVREFIELLRGSDVQVNWEIKDYPTVEGEEFANTTLERLVGMIKEAGLVERSMLNSFSDKTLERARTLWGDSFTLHGQGIGACARSKDLSDMPREQLYDWCCLYPNVKGARPIDFPENFGYCVKNEILPCVCVPDEEDTYREYIALGCKMFTSNDIIAADEILRKLEFR